MKGILLKIYMTASIKLELDVSTNPQRPLLLFQWDFGLERLDLTIFVQLILRRQLAKELTQVTIPVKEWTVKYVSDPSRSNPFA